MISRITLVASLGLLITACGSGSDPFDPLDPFGLNPDTVVVTPQNDDTQNDAQNLAVLKGRVVDAVNSIPLAGVTVSVGSGSREVNGESLADGSFEITGVAPGNNVSVRYSLNGFLAEQYSGVNFSAGTPTILGAVRLVSEDNAGLGTLSGTITSAVDGLGIPGLTLNFRRGINVRTGSIVATTTTDVNGNYIVPDIGYGNVTCEIIGVGFNTSYATVTAVGNIEQVDQNTSLSPNLNTGELRIVLTWGSTPGDLDSHFTGPIEGSDDYFHVYFALPNAELANLDVDDTSAFGPETVTMTRQLNGVYRYTVYNYSDNGPDKLSASQARVQVFNGTGLIADYFVPNGRGNLWTVFDLQGGSITPINTITERTSVNDHFPVLGKLSSDELAAEVPAVK